MFSLDNDQTILQTLLIDTEDDIMMITPTETRDGFKLIKGESGSAALLPNIQNLGENDRINYGPRDCLIPQQTDCIYKKVKLGSLIN